jgi:fatty-acyl-CoA synthase
MFAHLLLEIAAEAAPDRIAVGSRTAGLSMQGLLEASRRAADWIGRLQGRTVTYAGLNGPAFPMALFGASMAGRPLSPLNYRLPDQDLRRLVARSAPTTALFDADMITRVAGVADVECFTTVDFEALCHTAAPAQMLGPSRDAGADDIAVVLFTSGTTSEPKAAILRHRHLTAYALSTLQFLGAGEDEATLISVPPYHIAGVSAVLTSIYSGRRMVQLPTFTPDAWVDAVVAESITHAMVVPTMLGRVLDSIERRHIELTSLRALSYGGGRMPGGVIERAMDLLPSVNFVNAYGLTETSSTISVLDPDSHRAARAAIDPHERRRLTSVGKPLPTLEIEIRDEQDRPLAANEVGEIWVRGEQVSGEYAAGNATRSDGWFATHDAGWLDEEGYLYVEGRLDDVIVRGGENISPSEIEDALRLHPSVADVAVLGLPDDEWGQKIVAVVVANFHVARADLQALVRSRLRSTRVPQEIYFRPSLPYNETGKLLRRLLQSELVGPDQLTRDVAAIGLT